jgi:hypothetical protein
MYPKIDGFRVSATGPTEKLCPSRLLRLDSDGSYNICQGLVSKTAFIADQLGWVSGK